METIIALLYDVGQHAMNSFDVMVQEAATAEIAAAILASLGYGSFVIVLTVLGGVFARHIKTADGMNPPKIAMLSCYGVALFFFLIGVPCVVNHMIESYKPTMHVVEFLAENIK
jgi:hypothetical protein